MGREWRKLVKKLRRKRIRQKCARLREKHEEFLDEDLEVEDNEYDMERQLRHEQWLRKEEEAQRIWQEKERLKIEQEQAKQRNRERIRTEWEAARLQKEKKQKEEELEREKINSKITAFIETGGKIPEQLLTQRESNSGKELCPFFSKVAACRFGLECSRNHVTPGISKFLLIPNFYSHFSLYQSKSTEYGTDMNLEFDEKEIYRDFREFFYDITEELEKLGELRVMQVCQNSQTHLRGNVYLEYNSEREALTATRALNARWYGGRQLSINFINLPDWNAAICGDFHRGRCPKGNECNFLHTFRNPAGRLLPKRSNPKSNSVRSWRWSESPERPVDHRSSRSHSRDRHRQDRQRKRSLSRENSCHKKRSSREGRSRRKLSSSSRDRDKTRSP